jgi:hypothetical protein
MKLAGAHFLDDGAEFWVGPHQVAAGRPVIRHRQEV